MIRTGDGPRFALSEVGLYFVEFGSTYNSQAPESPFLRKTPNVHLEATKSTYKFVLQPSVIFSYKILPMFYNTSLFSKPKQLA